MTATAPFAPDHAELLEELREVRLLRDLSEERLAWLASRAEPVALAPGEHLFREGETGDRFWVILEGALETTKDLDGAPLVLTTHDAKGFIGVIGLLTNEPYGAATHAIAPTRLAAFDSDTLYDLLRAERSVARTVLGVFRPVYQRLDTVLHQREKLTALGSLAAGLAHELNNPASAARRAAAELRRTVEELAAGARRLAALGPERLTRVADLADQAVAAAVASPSPDPLAAGEREEALRRALEARGVREAWRLASPLAAAGAGSRLLDEATAAAGAEGLADALSWTAARLAAESLAADLERATGRISDLVDAVRSYTYLDRPGPAQEVDVHEGLESTLAVLRHDLAGIQLERDYAPELPRVPGHGAELNQVWTNLIRNAIDAVEGRGTIQIRTSRVGDRVLVEVADDGPGIASEVQRRVFEPFFTTKPVGKGTGLGLDVSHRIVVGRHRGDIRVVSQPGDTRFQVRLPITA